MARNDIKAGSAYVELLLRDKKFRKGLSSAGRGLKSFAKSALLLAGPLVAGFSFTKMIQSASDLEETMNKFNVVFGENARRVKEWGDNFADEVGRSEEQIARFMAGAQDLFVPLGFEASAAEEMSKQITGLSIDLASFNNMQDEDTMRDLQAALTGSGEVMKKYGVIVNEAAVKQELLNQRIDPKKATDQQKVQARLNIIMEGTTAAQGDAVRSAGSFANQLKALKGRVSDAAATIGSAFLPMATSMITRIGDVIGAIQDFAVGAIATWQEAFSTIVATVSSAWGGVTADTGSVMTWLQDTIFAVLSAVSFAFKNWENLVATVFVGVSLGVVRFANQVAHQFTEVIPSLLSWFFENWRDYFTDVANVTRTVASNIWANLSNLWDAIEGLFQGRPFEFNWTPLMDGFETAIKELPKIAEREIGPLEKQLQKDLAMLTEGIARDFDKHNQDFKAKVEERKKAIAGAFEPPENVEGGGGAVEAAAKNARNTAERIFASFSASALAAQGQGGGQPEDKVVKAIKEAEKQKQKRDEKLINAVKEAGGVLAP